MKIVIFGAGNSFIEYKNFCIDFWNEVGICVIFDNDKQKWGKELCGVKIRSPVYIQQYEYDLVLICSAYEYEIKEQLVFEYNVSEEKIKTRRVFFDEVIFLWYEKIYKDKKILILGEKYKYDNMRYLYQEFFNVVGFVELDNIATVNNYNYDYILLTCYEPTRETEIKNEILCFCHIKEEYLLTNSIFLIFRNHIKHFSNGEKFPDKNFLIICLGNYIPGLGTIWRQVINIVSYAKQNDYIPVVDMKTYQNQYLEEGEIGSVNAWEKFFVQPYNYTLEDIAEAKNISKVYTEIKWEPIYKNKTRTWLPQMKYSLSEKIKKYLVTIEHKRVLGVLYRGTDYSQQKPFRHCIQPSLETMINMTKKKMVEWGGFDLVFLCTEVQQACNRFEEEFGSHVIYYPQLRFDAEVSIERLALYSFGIKDERTKRGEDYWIALNILSSCNSIIAGQCGGTAVALTLNNNQYENIYLFELGRYGMDAIE